MCLEAVLPVGWGRKLELGLSAIREARRNAGHHGGVALTLQNGSLHLRLIHRTSRFGERPTPFCHVYVWTVHGENDAWVKPTRDVSYLVVYITANRTAGPDRDGTGPLRSSLRV